GGRTRARTREDRSIRRSRDRSRPGWWVGLPGWRSCRSTPRPSGSRRGSCSPAWAGVAAPPADPRYGGHRDRRRSSRRAAGRAGAGRLHVPAAMPRGWSIVGWAAFGGIAYAFLAAMTATSFDRTAAWLGPRRWSRLHTTGAYYLWAIFFVSFAPRVLQSPLYWPFAIVLLAAFVLRLSDRRLRRTAGFTVATAR